MATNFAGNTAARVSVPSPQTLGTGSTFTTGGWYYFATAPAFRRLGQKTNVDWLLDAVANNIQCWVNRGTTPAQVITNSGAYVAGRLYFLAFTYSETNGSRLFRGTPSLPAVEETYGTQTIGAGNTSADSAAWVAGNDGGFTDQFSGTIEDHWWVARELSVADIRTLQFGGRVRTMAFRLDMAGGAGLLHDLTGNKKVGTCTSTQAAPDRRPSAGRLWLLGDDTDVIVPGGGGGGGAFTTRRTMGDYFGRVGSRRVAA